MKKASTIVKNQFCKYRSRAVRPSPPLPPQAAERDSPSQIHCMYSAEMLRENRQSPGQKENTQHLLGVFFLESGNDLLFRAVSSQVPSALKGLTSVFGMGTGGTLSPLSPECL